MEAHLDGAVWFVDREGNMITSAHSDGYPTAPTAIEDFNPAEIGSAKYEVGTYHDYFKEDMITVIAPVVHPEPQVCVQPEKQPFEHPPQDVEHPSEHPLAHVVVHPLLHPEQP